MTNSVNRSLDNANLIASVFFLFFLVVFLPIVAFYGSRSTHKMKFGLMSITKMATFRDDIDSSWIFNNLRLVAASKRHEILQNKQIEWSDKSMRETIIAFAFCYVQNSADFFSHKVWAKMLKWRRWSVLFYSSWWNWDLLWWCYEWIHLKREGK